MESNVTIPKIVFPFIFIHEDKLLLENNYAMHEIWFDDKFVSGAKSLLSKG